MRRVFDGMGIVMGVASVLFVLGVMAVVLEVQSPTFVLWDGIKVHGVTHDGLTSYHYGGIEYSIDNPQASASDHSYRSTTVWLSKSDPTDNSRAETENAYNRWTDFIFVMVWFVLAAGLLTWGFARRAVRRRQRVERFGQSGGGLGDDVVSELLARRRAAPAVKLWPMSDEDDGPRDEPSA